MSEFTPERIAKDNELIENTSLLHWIFQKDDYDGKNWLLFTMDFGGGSDGKTHTLYVTTDHAHGDDLGDAESDLEYVLLACNSYPDALDEITSLRSELERVKAENEWHKYPDEKPVVPDGSYGVDIWGEYEVEFDAFDGVRFEKVIGQVQFLLSDFEEKEYYDPPQLLDINNNPIHKLLRWTALPAAPEEGE